MDEVDSGSSGCLSPTLYVIAGIILFIIGLMIDPFGETIPVLTWIIWIFSLLLIVAGIAIFAWRLPRQKETNKDTQKDDVVLTEDGIKRQKRTAYILGFVLIVVGISPIRFLGVSTLFIVLGVVIILWAWFRPINKK